MSNQPNAKMFTHDGKTMSLYGWAKHLGIDRVTLKKRIFNLGWPVEEALSSERRAYVKAVKKSPPKKAKKAKKKASKKRAKAK